MLLNEIINEVGMTKRAVKYYEEKGLLSVDNYNEEQSFISIDSKNTGKGRVILAMKESLRMTEGSISQKIIFFAIPLFLGNLFQ